MATDDNYMVFRECLSSAIVSCSECKPKTSKRRPKAKRSEREVTDTDPSLPERADPEELAEFIDVSTFPAHIPARSMPNQAIYKLTPTL